MLRQAACELMSVNNVEKTGLFAEERKQSILEVVNTAGKVTVAELCARYEVSPATIRNDLQELEETGLLKRTHGGAVRHDKISYEMKSVQKQVENVAQKRAIAAKAIEYIEEGDTIVLDTGTTTFELAKMLGCFNSLMVVTCDFAIASYLEQYTNIDVLMTGGMLRRGYHCLVGSLAIESMRRLNVDKCFLAANGVSVERAITTPNLDQALVASAMIELANETILLADSSKIGRYGFVKIANLNKMDAFITDSGIDEAQREAIIATGIALDIVEV